LSTKNMIISLLLVFLCAGPSLGGVENATAEAENATIVDAAAASTNESAAQMAESAINLSYIWSVSNIEAGPITMVINQDGSELLGQAKYEPESGAAWNGDVTGSVSGSDVDLTMTAQKEGVLFTTKMTGKYASDTITGNWTQFSGGKKVGNGTFMAIWVSPDTASYMPAAVVKPVTATQQAQSSNAASIPNSIEITDSSFQPNVMNISTGTTVTWINSGSSDQQIIASNGEFDSGKIAPGGQYQYTFLKAGTFDYYSKINSAMTGKVIVTDNSKSRFVDVHQYKDKIGPGGDLSGIPPGMGGSGLN